MDERSLDYVVEVIQHYATSLRHGHRHAYESLPRMLTLWFDVGAAAAAAAAAAGGAAGAEHAGAGAKERKVATTATNSLKDFSQKLPLYTWLPALPQLTSRLCHPHGDARADPRAPAPPGAQLPQPGAVEHDGDGAQHARGSLELGAARFGSRQGGRVPGAPALRAGASLCDQLIRVCAFQPKPLANGRSAKSFSVRSGSRRCAGSRRAT